MSYSVDHRCSSDLAGLWLWRRPATAAPIQSLSQELLCAAGVALQRKKNAQLFSGAAVPITSSV